MINTGWATYWEVEFYSFHGTFMHQMSEQLLLEANQLTGVSDLASCGFRLFYGINGVESSHQAQRGSTKVHLLFPNSTSLAIQVHWRSKQPVNAPLYQQDLSNAGVVFQWDDTFPVEEVLSLCKPS